MGKIIVHYVSYPLREQMSGIKVVKNVLVIILFVKALLELTLLAISFLR